MTCYKVWRVIKYESMTCYKVWKYDVLHIIYIEKYKYVRFSCKEFRDRIFQVFVPNFTEIFLYEYLLSLISAKGS